MILLQQGKHYTESKYSLESDFERMIMDSHKVLFGENTIIIDAKRKIGSSALGNTIPDGFLFDMSDPENREFYLIEVELVSHGFYDHMFPQITKFFAFFNDTNQQRELIEKLFSIINTDAELKKQFKQYLGEREIFKFLTDVIDSSQNILMLIDGNKPELPTIINTYKDTWGKMVKVIMIKRFMNKDEAIFSVDPEFSDIEYTYQQGGDPAHSETPEVAEEFHLESVGENVKEIYRLLKQRMLELKGSLVFNPAKYYISIRDKKAFAYFKFRKKKLVVVVMLPEDQIRQSLCHHHVKELSESVQNYYNGSCASVDIPTLEHIDDIVDLLKVTMECNL
jgi:predicted transport protein